MIAIALWLQSTRPTSGIAEVGAIDAAHAMLNFFAKRKLRRKLSEYLTPEAVQELLDGRMLDSLKIHSGRIEFVFVFVRANSPQQLAERIGFVADAGIEHDAVVHDLVGPMVVMAFGTLKAPPSSHLRQQLVTHLQQQLSADIKIVHGSADGHFGNFGSEKCVAFTFTFPRFDTALATLGRLQFGQTEELSP